MAIRAVVLDIGGVLEVIDDDVFPAPAERRLGLAPGTIAGGLAGLPGDAVVGEVTEHQVRAEWQRALALDDRQVDALLDDFWRWYVGTLDRELFDWFAGQRPARLTAILSNSGPGARERERCHGFEDVTDDIVYSHEVGLAKPDPAAYELVTRGSASRPGRSSSSTTSRPTSSPREPSAGTPSSTATPRRRSRRWSASSRPRTSDTGRSGYRRACRPTIDRHASSSSPVPPAASARPLPPRRAPR